MHLPAAFSVALLALTVACSSGDSDTETTGTEPGHETAREEAPVTSTVPAEPPAETDIAHEADSHIPTVEDISAIDTTDPEAVAAGWACAYWSHPRGESADERSERLAPLSTDQITNAVSQLRVDLDLLIIETVTGHVEPTSDETWTVHCSVITIGTDRRPTGPPEAVTTELQLVDTPDGWRVDQATLDGGLTLP